MAINVAINGFGRIGRLVFRGAHRDRRFNIVAVNDLTDSKTLAHLLKYDSVHGRYPGKVNVLKNGDISVDGKRVKVLTERDPAALPWEKLGVDVVMRRSISRRARRRSSYPLRPPILIS